jgi:hypothetical protein
MATGSNVPGDGGDPTGTRLFIISVNFFFAENFLRNITGVRMTNQPATASQKTDEVTNKTTPSMTVDTIFSGTDFTPLQWVAMEREHS